MVYRAIFSIINISACYLIGGVMCTYNLGFFFGPGLPLGFGIPSGIGVDLFTPLEGDPFFFVPLIGVNASCCGGAGVEFASEFISVEATGLN